MENEKFCSTTDWKSIQDQMQSKTQPASETCPNCGYCRHCGRGRQVQPYYPTYPTYPWSLIWCGTTDSNTGGCSNG